MPRTTWPLKDDLAEWGLFVREPFAERIVAGAKTWELRKRATNRRGRIGILSERGFIGTVELHGVLGPFRVEDLAGHVDKHRAPMRVVQEYAASGKLWAWVMREPVRLPEPVAVRTGRGPVVWFRLKRTDAGGSEMSDRGS